MTLFQALVLGVLQGATEFLPVSSSGHLTLVPWLLGWTDPGLTFDAMVHLGTLVAVLIYFYQDIIGLIKAWVRTIRERSLSDPEGRLAWLIILSAIPAALMGFLLEDWVEGLLGSPLIVSILLLVTGSLIVLGETLGKRDKPLEHLSVIDALLIGIAQGCAIAPGISRSGATISAGLGRRLDRESATRFSFLMVIPVITGAAAWTLYSALSEGLSQNMAAALGVGFVAALICGYLAIRWLLALVRTHSLKPFSYYCWAVGIAGIILSLVR